MLPSNFSFSSFLLWFQVLQPSPTSSTHPPTHSLITLTGTLTHHTHTLKPIILTHTRSHTHRLACVIFRHSHHYTLKVTLTHCLSHNCTFRPHPSLSYIFSLTHTFSHSHTLTLILSLSHSHPGRSHCVSLNASRRPLSMG